MRRLTRAEWTLLVLAEAEGQPVTRLELQKALFLLGKRLPEEVGDDFFSFAPYNYGPFCQSVYFEAERLIASFDVAAEGTDTFSATPAGLARAAAVEAEQETRDVIARVVEWVRSLGFSELCRAVYRMFPEMEVRSVLRRPISERPASGASTTRLVEWFEALSPEDRAEADRLAELGIQTGGDPDVERELRAKRR